MLLTQTLQKNSPRALYKYLLRECQKLPKGANQFYKHSVKQSFKQHVNESDEERIHQIMQKALNDAKWVIQKYKNNVQPKADGK